MRPREEGAKQEELHGRVAILDADLDDGATRTGKRYAVTNTAVKAKLKKSILVRWKDPLVRKVFYAWRRCSNAAGPLMLSVEAEFVPVPSRPTILKW